MNAVLTSPNTAFLTIIWSRFKQRLISMLSSLTTVWQFRSVNFWVIFWAFWERDMKMMKI